MKTIEALRQTLYDALPRRIFREEEPLARHTSFRIGGPAELMAFPTEPAQLQALLRLAHEAGVAPHILGAGTNVLAPDAGLRGLTICLREQAAEQSTERLAPSFRICSELFEIFLE